MATYHTHDKATHDHNSRQAWKALQVSSMIPLQHGLTPCIPALSAANTTGTPAPATTTAAPMTTTEASGNPVSWDRVNNQLD